ncbi:MAG: Fe(2+)-trafficking protein [Limnohabitans sp.]|jgi:Fe-S cluster biosynthesis and repair protein YggX|nr:Fe(2+)-trafficking protein [Limnohabitans sp.]
MNAERIAQFEKMAAADPSNEMAHFSLGNAYLQAGRFAEAAQSLERCVAANPEMSKAYQLGGEAMIKAGWEDKAVAFLEKGFAIAASKGDRLPQLAMGKLLESIGRVAPLLKEESETADRLREAGAFVCRRTGRPGTKMTAPPMRGPIGAWIGENISQETWKQWIGQGTKVINELRLDFTRDRDQEMYDQHMREYLGIDEEVLKEISTSGAPAATRAS